jgi:hypothetical protein
MPRVLAVEDEKLLAALITDALAVPLNDLKLVIEEALRERGRDRKVLVNTGFCCS